MLHSDLSSGSQAVSPHIIGCLWSLSVTRQQTMFKEVSALSQDFALDLPSVNVKWMNEYLTLTVSRFWKTYFHFYKIFSLKNASKNNWWRDSISEYNLEMASWEIGLSVCCLCPSCSMDWFKDLNLRHVK